MYKISRDTFESRYIDKNPKEGKIPFKHESNALFKDLPFVVKDKFVTTEFTGVVGEYVRILTGKKLKTEIVRDEILDGIKEHISGKEEAYQLRQIIKQVYFNDQKELVLFSNRAMLYTNANSNDKKIAQFLYDVLNQGRDSEKVRASFEEEADSVLDDLMYELLPSLEERSTYEPSFTPLVPYVSELFIEDFKYVIGEKERFQKYIKKLLQYYYFFYISQLAIKLDQMFKANYDKVEELFFTVEWEKMTKSRQNYDFGWKKLEPYVKRLFSHSKLLEMINQDDAIKHQPNENADYKRIAEEIEQIKGTTFNEDIKYLIDTYKQNITDFSFDAVSYDEEYEEELFNDIAYLYKCIDAQFQGTSRERAYTGYSKWFIEFCKCNILKNRRSLGYTLNLTEEDIIFLTKLCIKDEEKIKLKDLFKEFARRGIMLDQKTKEQINSYYEKLNLIEKKSDSGDAQYVKGIL
ncbi:MAG: DNA phosphorothioation-dependent restriction protein DptG [Cellulosilyticum sp.]|nr:DNA phosphorothioation-dependent restriction protein DptG [Cellulosilyticum sp.]